MGFFDNFQLGGHVEPWSHVVLLSAGVYGNFRRYDFFMERREKMMDDAMDWRDALGGVALFPKGYRLQVGVHGSVSM